MRRPRYMKGWAGDIFFVFIFFLIIPVIMVVVMKYVSIQLSAAMANTITSSYWLNQSNQAAGILNLFDIFIPLWVLGSCVAVFFYAAFLKSSPIAFGAGLMFMFIMVFVSFYIANTMHTVLTTPPLDTTAIYYPISLQLVDAQPILVGVLTMVYFLVGITKYRSGEIGSDKSVVY